MKVLLELDMCFRILSVILESRALNGSSSIIISG